MTFLIDLSAGPVTKSLQLGDAVQFVFNNETHTVKLVAIDSERAYFTVASDPVSTNLLVSESKKYDLDGFLDNSTGKTYDIKMTLESKYPTLARVTFEQVSEVIPGTKPAVIEPVVEEDEEEEVVEQNETETVVEEQEEEGFNLGAWISGVFKWLFGWVGLISWGSIAGWLVMGGIIVLGLAIYFIVRSLITK